MSKKQNTQNEFVPEVEPVETITPVEETIETPVEEVKESVVGVVVDCSRLRIRKKPNANADVLCEIPKSAKVEIDEKKSTKVFYKVTTSEGVEGFCMKQYISIAQ